MNKPKIIPLLFLGLLAISLSPIIARVLTSSATIISFWRMFIASSLLWTYSIIYYDNFENLSFSNKIRTSFSGVLLGLHFIFFY